MARGPSTQTRGPAPLDLIPVGVILKAHGLRGEVTVQPHNADSPLWRRGTKLYALPADAVATRVDRLSFAPTHSWQLTGKRQQLTKRGLYLLCQLSGVGDRDAAEALHGLHLAVTADALPTLGDNEFYHVELVGYAVSDAAGLPLGVVTGVVPAPAQDLLEVTPPTGEGDPVLVPFVAALVTHVDRQARAITLTPPEGMFP